MVGLLDGLFAALIFVTVALTALAVGLVIRAETVAAAVKKPRFAAVIGLNTVVVPLIGFLVARSMPLSPAVEVGIVICAICSGGPLALKACEIARADLGWSLALTTVLLGLNVVTIPVWSTLLLGGSLSVRPADLAGVLVLALVVPFAFGTGIRAFSRTESVPWVPWIVLASNVTLVVAVAFGIAANADELMASGIPMVLLVALGIVLISGVLGWLPRDDTPRRRTNILSTVNRATSVALLVAARAFSDQPEVLTAAVAFGLVQTVAAISVALYWRWSPRRARMDDPAFIPSG